MKKHVFGMIAAVIVMLGATGTARAWDMGKVGEPQTVSGGYSFAAAIDEAGTLWTWGFNRYGQLGNGTREGGLVPTAVLEDVMAVSVGGNHVLAIKTDNTLWAWGRNSDGQLGNGGQGERWDTGLGTTVTDQPTPVKIMDGVVAVSAGYEHSMAIKEDGSLWGWGYNYGGRLGDGTEEKRDTPVKIMDDVIAVSAGESHTVAIKADGSLWGWGDNTYGELGNGKQGSSEDGYWVKQTTPVKIMDGVVAASVDSHFTAAIKTDGSLWTWGKNDFDQMGNGGKGDFTSPLRQTVPLKIMDNVAAVSTGRTHGVALKRDGTLWSWGSNVWGQQGNGTTGGSYKEPKQIMSDVATMSAGTYFTLAVQTDGSLWGWGENGMEGEFSSIGNGGAFDTMTMSGGLVQSVPVQVMERVKYYPITEPPASEPSPKPAGSTEIFAYPSTQAVEVDGRKVEFQCYALKDENGNDTNYIKLRDLADILNGTAAQFEVGWNGAVTITTGQSYTRNGSEQKTPFSGPRVTDPDVSRTVLDGNETVFDAFCLRDDAGGGYNYYKLRDLGDALGFAVDWSVERGIYIETK